MNEFIKKYEEIWKDTPVSLLDNYNYHLKLTENLDNLKSDKFDFESLYKIVLWKLNRFPYIEQDLINRLKNVSTVQPQHHEECGDLIKDLLKTPGIALPISSTILRFLNPRTFQIIDDRTYRILFPGKTKYPSKGKKVTDSYLKKSVEIYFKYLDKIHEISSEKLPFEYADRILYLLDIKLGNKIGSKT
ncbi:MAG: hypothetical protein CSB23_03050 [Deltaproteobacteria bacterium]|nr:MAG: hypothetical protein CSB23_03050 [Deltaproteobacteria bacterium]